MIMFDRQARMRHALFIRNQLTENILNLNGKVLDAKVVGDPELIAKLEKLRKDTKEIADYLDTKLDAKEA